jgi:hypothetical protein
LVKEIERELGGCGTILGGEAGMHLTILIDGIKDKKLPRKLLNKNSGSPLCLVHT